MDAKEVRKNLHHQIWYSVTNQEEKEIKRNKGPTQLTLEQQKEAQKKYIAWKVRYLSAFLRDR